jgi:hypothetical protein
MTDIAVQREVARIDSPPIGRGLSESHRDRQRIPFGIWAFTRSKFSCAGILTRHLLKGLARRCHRTPSKVLEEKKLG